MRIAPSPAIEKRAAVFAPIPPPPGPKTVRPIHANVGLRIKYLREMLVLIEQMHFDVQYWISTQYRSTPPLMATDARLPSREMQARFRDLAKKWKSRFDREAPRIAEAYLEGQFKATDSAMRMALKDAGFAVKFQMTPAMRDALAASLSENVGLIKSIPEQYLQKVEGAISRAYASGQNLKQMVERIKKIYPITAERADLITRDQANKANAVIVKARQMDIGITEAFWIHSHGGKVPRPDHLAANGRRYKIAEGCFISGEYIQPGEKINCRCVSRSILPTLVA